MINLKKERNAETNQITAYLQEQRLVPRLNATVGAFDPPSACAPSAAATAPVSERNTKKSGEELRLR